MSYTLQGFQICRRIRGVPWGNNQWRHMFNMSYRVYLTFASGGAYMKMQVVRVQPFFRKMQPWIFVDFVLDFRVSHNMTVLKLNIYIFYFICNHIIVKEIICTFLCSVTIKSLRLNPTLNRKKIYHAMYTWTIPNLTTKLQHKVQPSLHTANKMVRSVLTRSRNVYVLSVWKKIQFRSGNKDGGPINFYHEKYFIN